MYRQACSVILAAATGSTADVQEKLMDEAFCLTLLHLSSGKKFRSRDGGQELWKQGEAFKQMALES